MSDRDEPTMKPGPEPVRRYRVEVTQVHDWGKADGAEVELRIVGYENIDRHCLPRAGDPFYLVVPEFVPKEKT